MPGQARHKSGTRAGRAGGRNRAAVVFADFFANGEPDARALELTGAIQPLENGEDLVGIFWIEPDPVVRHD